MRKGRTHPSPSKRLLRGLAIVAAASFVALSIAGCDVLRGKERTFGDECVNSDDCDTKNCTKYGDFCTRACTYDRDCGKSLVCRSDKSAAGNSCAQPIGAAVGTGCRNPEGCASGHCIKLTGKDDEPGLCSRYCLTAGDCPANMNQCVKLGNTGLLKMCLPPDPAAPASTATTRPRKK